jgi:hypothetical protein
MPQADSGLLRSRFLRRLIAVDRQQHLFLASRLLRWPQARNRARPALDARERDVCEAHAGRRRAVRLNRASVNFLYLLDDLLCPSERAVAPQEKIHRSSTTNQAPVQAYRGEFGHCCKSSSHIGASDKHGDRMPPRTAPPLPTSQQFAQLNQRIAQQDRRIAQQDRLIAQQLLDDARRDKREHATATLSIIEGTLRQREQDWINGALMVGSAYRQADDDYNKALADQNASDALRIQIAFSILTVLATGTLGWIGAASIAAAESKLIEITAVEVETVMRTMKVDMSAMKAEAVMLQKKMKIVMSAPKPETVRSAMTLENVLLGARDATSQAVAGEISSIGPPMNAPLPDPTVSINPQKFQNDLEIKVRQVLGIVIGDITGIRKRYDLMSLSDWDNYDSEVANTASLTWQEMAEGLAGATDLPSEAWMAREVERGRWAAYILQNHGVVGSKVRDRLTNLGVAAAAYMRETGVSYPVAKPDSESLLNWAKNYELRKFTDEKKKPRGGGPDHQ